MMLPLLFLSNSNKFTERQRNNSLEMIYNGQFMYVAKEVYYLRAKHSLVSTIKADWSAVKLTRVLYFGPTSVIFRLMEVHVLFRVPRVQTELGYR